MLRRIALDLNLGAANQHLFGVNTLLTTQVFGTGNQAQNMYAEPVEVQA